MLISSVGFGTSQKVVMCIQDGSLVINGLITPINGRKQMGNPGVITYNPYKWIYGPTYNWWCIQVTEQPLTVTKKTGHLEIDMIGKLVFLGELL